MFSDDGYTEADNERLKKEVQDLKDEVTTLTAAVQRRDQTNGNLMDQIECQKELLAEKSAEINDLNQRYHNASMEKLDLCRALAASQASVQQAQEEIGRLQLINRCPNAYSALVADLTRYVTDSMEEFQEGYG